MCFLKYISYGQHKNILMNTNMFVNTMKIVLPTEQYKII